jgi:hypothetical protein
MRTEMQNKGCEGRNYREPYSRGLGGWMAGRKDSMEAIN